MAEKTARIEFTDYPGKAFILRLSPVALDDYLALAEQWDAASDITELRALLARFKELAWVGTEGYDPEPELGALDMSLIKALIRQWMAAYGNVPLPLAQPSGAGGRSKARPASRSRQS